MRVIQYVPCGKVHSVASAPSPRSGRVSSVVVAFSSVNCDRVRPTTPSFQSSTRSSSTRTDAMAGIVRDHMFRLRNNSASGIWTPGVVHGAGLVSSWSSDIFFPFWAIPPECGWMNLSGLLPANQLSPPCCPVVAIRMNVLECTRVMCGKRKCGQIASQSTIH